MKGKWSSKEILFLKENYDRLSIPALAKKLSKSEAAVRSKARRLGIKLKVKPKPRWSEHDIDLLEKYYETGSKEYLMKLFPRRSWSSIDHKGRRLQHVRSSIRHYLRPRSMPELSMEDRLYIAGLVDGEGMITVSVKKNNAIPGKGGSPIQPLITISNTNKELIDYLKSLLHGSTLKTIHAKGRRKDCWTLQIARLLDVKALLEQIVPYLRVKKRQAKLLIEFCNVRLNDRWMKYNPRLFQIAKEIRRLNCRGRMIA